MKGQFNYLVTQPCNNFKDQLIGIMQWPNQYTYFMAISCVDSFFLNWTLSAASHALRYTTFMGLEKSCVT